MSDYEHQKLHHYRVAEQSARAVEARHARELPRPPRRDLLGVILAVMKWRPGRPRPAVRRATMTA